MPGRKRSTKKQKKQARKTKRQRGGGIYSIFSDPFLGQGSPANASVSILRGTSNTYDPAQPVSYRYNVV